MPYGTEDENGMYQLDIGGGDVKFVLKTNDIIPLYNEIRQIFVEDMHHEVTIILRSDWTKSEGFQILAVSSVIIFIIIVVFSLYRKRNRQVGS